MSEPKHTPGPWRIGIIDSDEIGYRSIQIKQAPDGKPVARAIPACSSTKAEVEANAHLIAAAPDLLAACEAALTQCEASLREYGESIRTPPERVRHILRTDPLLIQLRAAIDKAEPEGKGNTEPKGASIL